MATILLFISLGLFLLNVILDMLRDYKPKFNKWVEKHPKDYKFIRTSILIVSILFLILAIIEYIVPIAIATAEYIKWVM